MNKNNNNIRREALILQAQIYEALGDLKNSNIKWTQAMEIIPNDLSIIEYCTSSKTDKELVSKEILQKAFETMEMPDYIKHYKLAQINYNMKDYLKAKENILTSLENTLAHIPEILELAAQIDLNLNQKNQALKYLQEAESLSEQKDYYKKLIQKLEG
jgi:tetratricopeptide (TPR) repeat protein